MRRSSVQARLPFLLVRSGRTGAARRRPRGGRNVARAGARSRPHRRPGCSGGRVRDSDQAGFAFSGLGRPSARTGKPRRREGSHGALRREDSRAGSADAVAAGRSDVRRGTSDALFFRRAPSGFPGTGARGFGRLASPSDVTSGWGAGSIEADRRRRAMRADALLRFVSDRFSRRSR